MPAMTTHVTDLQMEVLEVLASTEEVYGPVCDSIIADRGAALYGSAWKPSILLSNQSFLILNKTLGVLLRRGLVERSDTATDDTRGFWALSPLGRDLLGLPPI